MHDSRPARPRGKATSRDTAALLIAAATAEFESNGFDGTDTNRIARRAGFAPQTFYRWFADKRAIFLACYRQWEAEETAMLDKLVDAGASEAAIADAVLAHHCRHLGFRRSLRHLSTTDNVVRQARAESRQRQIMRVAALRNTAESQWPALFAGLLKIERLADALAENEYGDAGIPESVLLTALIEEIASLP